MKLEILAVFDSAAEAYMRPMFVPAVGVGTWAFSDEVNRSSPDNGMYQHPQDFALYHFGNWDDNSGEFNLLDNPQMITRGVSVSEKAMQVIAARDKEQRHVS